MARINGKKAVTIHLSNEMAELIDKKRKEWGLRSRGEVLEHLLGWMAERKDDNAKQQQANLQINFSSYCLAEPRGSTCPTWIWAREDPGQLINSKRTNPTKVPIHTRHLHELSVGSVEHK